jgi:hypothetical protein
LIKATEIFTLYGPVFGKVAFLVGHDAPAQCLVVQNCRLEMNLVQFAQMQLALHGLITDLQLELRGTVNKFNIATLIRVNLIYFRWTRQEFKNYIVWWSAVWCN